VVESTRISGCTLIDHTARSGVERSDARSAVVALARTLAAGSIISERLRVNTQRADDQGAGLAVLASFTRCAGGPKPGSLSGLPSSAAKSKADSEIAIAKAVVRPNRRGSIRGQAAGSEPFGHLQLNCPNDCCVISTWFPRTLFLLIHALGSRRLSVLGSSRCQLGIRHLGRSRLCSRLDRRGVAAAKSGLSPHVPNASWCMTDLDLENQAPSE
jgi:hypothetical protein